MNLAMPACDHVLAAHIAGVLTDLVDPDHEQPSSMREVASPRPDTGSAAQAGTLDVDHDALKAALGRFASGVTIVSGMHDGVPAGFTCQSFFSVSLEPPLIALSVMATSSTYPRLRNAERIAVSVLAEDQRGVSNAFARSGTDKWAGVAWTPSPGGAPVIDGAVTWFECRIENEVEAGDHTLVIARVTALGQGTAGSAPLLYWAGDYRTVTG